MVLSTLGGQLGVQSAVMTEQDSPPAKRSAKKWPQNEARFRELILYICQSCATHQRFGATKLNKILYYSDFLAYADLDEPITGFEYQREKKGPVPTRLVPVREEMIKAGELALQPLRLPYGLVEKRVVNLRAPRLEVFTPAQISLVDSIIELLKDKTAEEASELSHRTVGWQIAAPGETIPYETVFVAAEPMTESDIQRGKDLAKRFPEYGSK
jgi:hypothetical protein